MSQNKDIRACDVLGITGEHCTTCRLGFYCIYLNIMHLFFSYSLFSLLLFPFPKKQTNITGRTGRTCPGVMFCLYSEQLFENLEKHAIPEMLRLSLASTILSLKVKGRKGEGNGRGAKRGDCFKIF